MSKIENIWAAVDGEPLADAEAERQITRLIHRAAAYVDAGQFVDYIDLYTEDASYSVITNENLDSGLCLMTDSGVDAFRERAAYHIGIWQVPRGKLTHMVSNIVVSGCEDATLASAVSNFLLTRTGDNQATKFHASGQYIDQFRRVAGVWRFQARVAVLDTNVLSGEFTDLI